MTPQTTPLKLCAALLAASAATFVLAAPDATALDPTVQEVGVGDTIRVARLPDNIYLRDVNDPVAPIWERITSYRIRLDAAPPVHRSSELRYDPAASGWVQFQFARTADRFYVRMRWPDTSENRSESVNEFSDGAAIQFALHGSDTNFMMGSGPEQPVNIWYWRANRDTVQNLAAGGYGSLTTLPQQEVSGKASYFFSDSHEDAHWRVVMSRELAAAGEHEVALESGSVPVSFAVWQGAQEQRDGNKKVNLGWLLVDLDSDS